MSTLPFDTHAFYLELVESGLAEKTAEALTKAVTKIELAKLEELRKKFAEFIPPEKYLL